MTMSMQPTKEQQIADLEWRLRYCHGEVNELTGERNAARAQVEELQDKLDDSVPKNWHGLVQILDYAYPEKVFPTLEDSPDRDLGPRVVSLLRLLTEERSEVARLQAELRNCIQFTNTGHWGDDG